MKTFGLFMILAAISAFFAYANQRTVASTTQSAKVGNRPGDIGKANDLDTAAESRGHELAMFAEGCFWGVEDDFRQVPGVMATAVGYSGGKVANPTYEQVCDHTTGHAETVLIEFDPKVVTYEKLLSVFCKNSSPTSSNPSSYQYRNAIFTRTPRQAETAAAFVARKKSSQKGITTIVEPASRFWLAEEYHQQYHEKGGLGGCRIK